MNAYLLSLNPDANIADQWDYGFLRDFLEGRLWKPPTWTDFRISNVRKLQKTDKAIVVIPARHHAGIEEFVNKQLTKIDHVILFLMGDEEAEFDISKIDHPSIHIWVQNPHIGKHDNYNKIGTGYPQHMKSYLPEALPDKNLDIFFAGQVTHQRRDELIDAITPMENKKVIVTDGFTRGDKNEYYLGMLRTKIAPCPSGAVIPDSFRLFEALECMAIPIADNKTPDGEILAYWDWLFEDICPFATVSNWYSLPDIVDGIQIGYPYNLHKITEWWIHYKRKFAYKVLEQLNT